MNVANKAEMALYEVINGYIGEAHLRVYVWASSPSQAHALARDVFQKAGERYKYKESYWKPLDVRFLFAASAEPFCTGVSDCGFEGI